MTHYYRFQESNDGSLDVIAMVVNLVTPNGVYIQHRDKELFISNRDTKPFAHRTTDEACKAFVERKRKELAKHEAVVTRIKRIMTAAMTSGD